MNKRLILVLLVVAALPLAAGDVRAAEIKGSVRSVSGETATVAVEGDLRPNEGDAAIIFFKLDGVEGEVFVANAIVSAVNGDVVQVKIENATGEVAKDQLVRFTSSATKAAGTPPRPSATSSPPAMPEPSRSKETVTIADLAADFHPATSAGTTSTDIRGTISGMWHYFQDTDLSTTNGNDGALLWKRHGKYVNSKQGYAGTDTDFGLIFPIISRERLLDGPTPPPPAGSLMGHPSGRRYLAIQYRLGKMEGVQNLAIQYRFEKPNLFHQNEVHIIKNSGGVEQVLFSKQDLGAGAANQVVTGTLFEAGTLGPGDSIWIMLGAAGDAAGDQTWLQLTLRGTPK